MTHRTEEMPLAADSASAILFLRSKSRIFSILSGETAPWATVSVSSRRIMERMERQYRGLGKDRFKGHGGLPHQVAAMATGGSFAPLIRSHKTMDNSPAAIKGIATLDTTLV